MEIVGGAEREARARGMKWGKEKRGERREEMRSSRDERSGVDAGGTRSKKRGGERESTGRGG